MSLLRESECCLWFAQCLQTLILCSILYVYEMCVCVCEYLLLLLLLLDCWCYCYLIFHSHTHTHTWEDLKKRRETDCHKTMSKAICKIHTHNDHGAHTTQQHTRTEREREREREAPLDINEGPLVIWKAEKRRIQNTEITQVSKRKVRLRNLIVLYCCGRSLSLFSLWANVGACL